MGFPATIKLKHDAFQKKGRHSDPWHGRAVPGLGFPNIPSLSGVQFQTLEWLWLKRICFGVILLTGCPTRDRLWIPKTPYIWSCGRFALVGVCACCGGRPVREQTDTPCWRLALELVMEWLVNNASSQHRQLTLLLPEPACSRARPAFACVRFNHHCALYLKRGNPLLGQSKWSILPYFVLLQVEWFFFLIFIKIRDLPQNHNWFLSPLPVYFFWACALFAQGTRNLGLFWLICCEFTHYWVFFYRAMVTQNWKISGMHKTISHK